tara:strand:+ start:237 stop:740 length:504 start_codon:yes stop_codon:yes gene_type:complete
MTFIILFLFLWIPCGLFTGAVAANKDYSGIAWAIGGFLFGPIALIAAAGLSDKRQRRYLRIISESFVQESSSAEINDSSSLKTMEEYKEQKNSESIGAESEGIIEGDNDYNSCLAIYRKRGSSIGKPIYSKTRRIDNSIALVDNTGQTLAKFRRKSSGEWHMPFWLN